MVKSLALMFISLIAAAVLGAPAGAQGHKPAVLRQVPIGEVLHVPPARQYLVPAAQLMRVDEGVFELEIGKTIDLTDRKMLLSVTSRGSNKDCCTIAVNGSRVNWNGVGSRIDLKRESSTRQFVEDKDVCYLDVVDIALPKGAAGIATFRLYCV